MESSPEVYHMSLNMDLMVHSTKDRQIAQFKQNRAVVDFVFGIYGNPPALTVDEWNDGMSCVTIPDDPKQIN